MVSLYGLWDLQLAGVGPDIQDSYGKRGEEGATLQIP